VGSPPPPTAAPPPPPPRSPRRVRSAGAGHGTALPERIVTNDEMAGHLDTNDEWVRARTGISERRMVGPGESTGQLALAAARDALGVAGLQPEDIDLILVATTTPEHPMPSTASEVAAALGSTAGAFDLNAACAGFVYALATAASFVDTGMTPRVLLIGVETMSRVVDQTDRSLAVLFGDGAAALVLGPGSADTNLGPGTETATGGILASDFVNDPEGTDLLVIPAGGSAAPASDETVAAGQHFVRMDGREVFRRAVRGVTDSVQRTLAEAGCSPEDIDLFVPHQANARIIDAVLNRVGLPGERAVYTVDRHGNTSAASIPLALNEAANDGRLRDGSLVLTTGFGAGLTIGTALVRWQTA
jgi:3-oxoacyl-[acyl-carrier-protein] synthase III